MVEENKYCCEQHMDMAFDDFLLENETFPDFEEAHGSKCSYCEKNADYLLKLSKKANI